MKFDKAKVDAEARAQRYGQVYVVIKAGNGQWMVESLEFVLCGNHGYKMKNMLTMEIVRPPVTH